MSPVLSEQLALRLGLADKALPEIELANLIGLLVDGLGEPLTEKRLRAMSPKHFRQLLEKGGYEVESAHLTQAYLVLTDDEVREMKAPLVPQAEPLTKPSIRIAVTSNNDEEVDGHFGSCLRVLVYDVNGEASQLVDVRPVVCIGAGEKRTEVMLELIKDCQILVTQSIGGPAAARVVRANCHPIKQPSTGSAQEVLLRLQAVLAGSPPPWLKKILAQQDLEVPQPCV